MASLVWPAPLIREDWFGSPYYGTVASFTSIHDKPLNHSL